MKGPLFYSKILLFGEYGIIKDSKGLSIPYNFFKGALKKSKSPDEAKRKSTEALRGFYHYLKDLSQQDTTLPVFDFEAFDRDLNEGMYFDSSIPQGYGVGSSGALVAAVYDRYAKDKITVLENLTRDKLLKIKGVFAAMESYFHGKSSGLDPLNSYLSLPILINAKDHIEPTGIPSQKTEGKGAVFLLDSGMTGETAPMVKIFMENLQHEAFNEMLQKEFVHYTNACVDDFLKADVKSLFSNIKQLSKVVLDNFKPMIPEKFHRLWKKGLETNAYYLKLCGSGGGGYILGFTEDFARAQKVLKNYKLEVVYNF